ncbi:PP2C family protein-serine/threonine phosphatase [Polynucleobacter paneuropaeus]|jgi:protein phosphatase|uniref:PP2C family protein-serine/threonine phosphatase n=1 Tax=Polynucleobacter paneuropaeus TaxID=2527775 RepID=UPI001BFD47A3|nr:protein phosphatase 2C domain-containing protein [Polynucleobacter paneuropaeus]MBT8622539.1 serine/threonine-protein phosphatase [Polynucleobacter paneuropaeus]
MSSKASTNEWNSEVDFSGVEFLGQRSNQEDYSLFRVFNQKQGLLVVLSDGMGGHTSGEIASKLSVNTFDSSFSGHPSESVQVKLGASLNEANSELSNQIKLKPQLDGMGCTLVGAYIDPDGLQWISVGDSLLYLYRANKLRKLNADHSMAGLVEESYRLGKISKAEAENYPNKNALRSAVMGADLPLIDSPKNPMKIFSGDILIVASDGLQTIDDDAIGSICGKYSNQPASKIANALLEAVKRKQRSNQDNTTIQVIKAPNFFSSPPIEINKYWLIPIVFLITLGVAALFIDQLKFYIDQLTGGKSDKSSANVVPVAIPTPPPNALDVTKAPESQISSPIAPLPAAPRSDKDKAKEYKKGNKGLEEQPLNKNNKDSKSKEPVDNSTKDKSMPSTVEGGLADPKKEKDSIDDSATKKNPDQKKDPNPKKESLPPSTEPAAIQS